MRSLLAALIMTLSGALSATAATPIKVYIIAGQSNAGSGGFHTTLEPQLIPPQNNLYQYRLTSTDIAESTNWEPLKMLDGKYFGAELSFGQEMQRRTGSPVAVIKIAASGTSLYGHWLPSANNLYPTMLDKVHSSLDQLVAQGYTPSVSAMMWIQGEGDTLNLSASTAYEHNLLQLVSSIRTDLNVPELPFLYNQAHVRLGRPYTSQLRQSQASAEQAGANMHMINIDDLGLNFDSVHFQGPTHAEVGRRFADVLAPSADFNFDGEVDAADFEIWRSSNGMNRRGDGNSDGVTDSRDLLLWLQQSGFTAPSSNDFNSDGRVDGDDLLLWKAGFGVAQYGDGNGDGVTDGTDFLAWQRLLGFAPDGSSLVEFEYSQAVDFDHDGDVDADDLAVWKTAFGKSLQADANSDGVTDGNDFLMWQRQTRDARRVQAIPEPSATVLRLAAVLAAALFRRRAAVQSRAL